MSPSVEFHLASNSNIPIHNYSKSSSLRSPSSAKVSRKESIRSFKSSKRQIRGADKQNIAQNTRAATKNVETLSSPTLKALQTKPSQHRTDKKKTH